MGMSTWVEGYRPPDEEWKKMKAIWDACALAGVTPPEEVSDFFNGEDPKERGIEVDLVKSGCAQEIEDVDAGRRGYEIEVDKIPPNVTWIRFVNGW